MTRTKLLSPFIEYLSDADWNVRIKKLMFLALSLISLAIIITLLLFMGRFYDSWMLTAVAGTGIIVFSNLVYALVSDRLMPSLIIANATMALLTIYVFYRGSSYSGHALWAFAYVGIYYFSFGNKVGIWVGIAYAAILGVISLGGLFAQPDAYPHDFLLRFFLVVAVLNIYMFMTQRMFQHWYQKLIASNIQLAEEKLRANQAAQIKSEFLANMSHEIRTPMNGVLGMLDLLQSEDLNPSQKENLEVAYASGKNLLQIINDILDYSKLESGKLVLEQNVFSLPRAINSLLSIVKPLAEEKNIELINKVHEDVPQWVIGDSTRLQQVLLNLLNNAIKFTQEGSVCLRVQTQRLAQNEVKLHFEVSDTGIGMAPQTLEKIFDRFVQADGSTTRKYGGSGLGLSISQNLLECMGSKLQMDSREGFGTKAKFHLVVPLGQAPTATESEKKHFTPPADLKILVVEDNFLNMKVIQKILDYLQMSYSIAQNGKEAVEKFSEAEFQLILMDCQMPVMDGYEAAQKIREMESMREGKSKCRIVAMTANVLREDLERCLDCGMDDFLLKPLRRKDVENCLLGQPSTVRNFTTKSLSQ